MKEDIKDIIEILELARDEIENNDENITATLDLQDLKSLKNLYDLYNKEKEKREIAEENDKVLSLDLGQALKELGLYEDTIIADELVLEINKRYINKEKIKEILDKYKFCKVENLKECYKELQELLEERN